MEGVVPVKYCPRCNGSMIAMPGDIYDAYARLWHCLSCGHESFRDTVRQAEDEALRTQLEPVAPQAAQVTG